MRQFESGWQNAEGVKFHVRGWEPDKRLKAVVLLVHGLGEHTGRYETVGRTFAAAGYALVGFDLRGHGRSGGPRGDAPSYDTLLDDLADFLTQMQIRYSKKPVFIYGHSLGGNLGLNFILRRKPKVKGAIVTSPWLKLAVPRPAAVTALASVVNRIAPALRAANGLEVEGFSHDPRIVETYKKDPLCHDRISVRMYSSMVEAGKWAEDHAAELRTPMLLMHGSGDRIVSYEASRRFGEAAGKKVTWRGWDGWYHEVHNEPQNRQLFGVMVDWLDDRLRAK